MLLILNKNQTNLDRKIGLILCIYSRNLHIIQKYLKKYS